MSQSYGVPGQSNDPDVDEAEEVVIRKAVERGLQVMITADSPEKASALSEKGVYLQTICFDVQFITRQFAALMAAFKSG